MRDRQFITEPRGGSLKKAPHIQLIKWACSCAENVLQLHSENPDDQLIDALNIAEGWVEGNVSVGDAIKASLDAHAVAKISSNQTAIAVARSVGHAVATAHMADHSLGAAWYALKAVKNTGKSVDAERRWQDEQLPLEIRELVLTARVGRKFLIK